MNKKQSYRYARHIIMHEIGENGQQKIINSKVLCVGAGGLGSPILQYLAGAGVGTIGIMDDDIVDISNLQRQTIHAGNDGISKVESAKKFIQKLNPDITINTYNERITPNNAIEIIKNYDIIVNCSDNFATIYLLNDASVILKKPFIYGSVFRFEGQAMTIIPMESPCYRCLFKQAPSPETIKNAKEIGVFGVLPGMVGIIQASEILKCIVSMGKLLTGRMIYCDILSFSFEEIKVQRDINCVVCGKNPKIKSIEAKNYECI